MGSASASASAFLAAKERPETSSITPSMAQARQLADSEEATAALREQLASLKDALRSMAAEKEAADVAATQVNQCLEGI